MARRARRERITEAFDVFHATVAEVFGAADRLTDAAARAHAEAMAEMWLRETGLDDARVDPRLTALFANPSLAHVVARVAADREAAFEAWSQDADGSGPERLTGIVADAAFGSAGDGDDWLAVGKADLDAPVPQLWRIGTGTVGPTGPEFPVAVPLLDAAHLEVVGLHRTRAAAEALVESLLMRVVSHFRPGLVQLHVWDVGRLTGSLPGLYPLTRSGLLTVHDPGDLGGLLTELSDRIRRVHTRVLVGGMPSLAEQTLATGSRTEPWVVAVLLGNGGALGEEDRRQLQRVLRAGPACGISVVLVDIPLAIAAEVERVELREESGRVVASTTMTGPHVTVVPDPPQPHAALTAISREIVVEHERWRTRVSALRDLLPPGPKWGTTQSIAGLCAPIGFTEGLPVELTLADAAPHALIGGPSGSGKTNLLLTMIASMAARYSPDELELYLLDFKEGVSFAQFAPGRRDPTWLPHARLIGVNINTDREFGLALLQHLADEMRHRAEVAKENEVTKLEELRTIDPAGRWPRIVAVIDEFQVLFGERDAVTREAVRLLEDVVRRGRSQGIHVVLASQDVSSIEAFWGRPAIFEQFVLRIGLPRARRVLAEGNDATLHLPRWHAVVNHESGIAHGNEIVRIPDATAKGSVDEVQRRLYELEGAARKQPRLFDGGRAPTLDELLAQVTFEARPPVAVVGQCMNVDGSIAKVPMPAAPGRNIGVVGTGHDDAAAVLGTAAAALGREHDSGEARFVLAPLVAEALPAAMAVERRLTGFGHGVTTVRLDGFRAELEQLAAEVRRRVSGADRSPIYLVLYAGDAADTVLEKTGTEALRTVLRLGPETGVHTIGWWRSPQRLKSLLVLNASPDDLGCVLGLDVQGAELGTLIPGLPPTWSPRPGRALIFDRARHVRPEVIIVAAPDEEELS
ncbi:MAG TPA: FtsK/SpoIIIE domain-containing protein [Pseudonocardia sp.]|nr:FtsK/SpoIIIE domain-containing protein [Pseudonocardia sp.]